MLIKQTCYECGETQTDDWDDEFAIPYLKNHEHMKLKDGTVVLPPEPCEPCDTCDMSWHEMMEHTDMNEDDRF